MQTLERALADLIDQGEISLYEGLSKASKPAELDRLMNH